MVHRSSVPYQKLQKDSANSMGLEKFLQMFGQISKRFLSLIPRKVSGRLPKHFSARSLLPFLQELFVKVFPSLMKPSESVDYVELNLSIIPVF
jgi:hypothetical protein